jgi:hypothetical protein
MKKRFPTSATRPSLIYIQSARAKGCVSSALILLTSCTSTQVRWDAVKMRQDVMVYYNDQIMENLVKARLHLPFVHVDIQSLSSQGASQITGSMGYGETTTNTGTQAQTNQRTITNTTSTSPTGPGTMHMVATIAGGLVATASHVAMRPFTYSVAPTRSETLSITAAPALGSQALTSPTPGPSSSPQWEETKKTTTTGPAGQQRTIEETLKPAKKPEARTVYDLYEEFLNNPKHFSKEEDKGCPTCPSSPLVGPVERGAHISQNDYIEGTLKAWHGHYYYIDKRCVCEYYGFCKALFTKGQTGSLEKQIEATRAEVETLRALQATPVPP